MALKEQKWVKWRDWTAKLFPFTTELAAMLSKTARSAHMLRKELPCHCPHTSKPKQLSHPVESNSPSEVEESLWQTPGSRALSRLPEQLWEAPLPAVLSTSLLAAFLALLSDPVGCTA